MRDCFDLNEKVKCLERNYGAGEMVQWVKAPPALPKVLSSIPSNYIMFTAICNEIWCPLEEETGQSPS